MSELVKINLTKHETLLFKKYAESKGISVAKAMKDAFFEKIENELKHPELCEK